MEVDRGMKADEGKEGDRGEEVDGGAEVDGEGDGAARTLSPSMRVTIASLQKVSSKFVYRRPARCRENCFRMGNLAENWGNASDQAR
jgi:hypothetical protein